MPDERLFELAAKGQLRANLPAEVRRMLAHDKVRELSQETGKEIPLVDNSPDMEGLQISLDSGEGRLFLLP